MPSKVQLYAQMADRTAEQITGSYQKWTAFLTTAARLYKYPYNEQLMIFAQRPEATACAEYDLWNKQMRRYVRRGSKGIALVDTSSDQPKLRYVFDVSDTSGGENSRRPYLWEYRQEHREVVSAALEQRFDVSGENGLADQMERVAAQLVDGALQDAPVPCHHHRARCRFHAQKARERAACRARTCIFPRRTIVSKLHGVCRGALLLCVACGNGACIYAARR